jgi:3-deoxy-D-manno-octulosonic-acid transferase
VRILFPYRLLQFITLPFVAFYFAFRLFFNRAYRANFTERLGFLPARFRQTASGCIWLHGVSAGEIATAVPLLRQFRIDEPRISIFVSTSTVAGRTAASHRLSGLADGVFYCPLDYASCVRRVLRTLKPSLVIILETEIWPNLYWETKRSCSALAIVNGRISAKSWPQYLSMKWFFGEVLRLPDVVFAQSTVDRDRYYRLGAPQSRLRLDGNLKYDACSSVPRTILPTFGASHVWIAASTVAPGESRHYKHGIDEDDIVLDAFEKLGQEFPSLLLILAPRQPTRFEAVAKKLETRGLPHCRKSTLDSAAPPRLELPGVLLLDTIGELAGSFPLAHAVFVGGSIAPRGGHNILEPAAWGAPIVVGPHMENFEGIARDFVEAGVLVQIEDAGGLLPAVGKLLYDRPYALDLGKRARMLVEQKQGAAQRIAAHLWPLYWSATPITAYGWTVRLILGALAKLWVAGGRAKRKRDLAHQRRLPFPVISIGGITIGGAGKTPITNYIARALRDRGYRPAILTRGYRRRTPAHAVILPAGADVSPTLTGDEAQIFLRSGICPVGIGSDRAETGQLLLQYHDVNTFLLDDGFQHARLHRDVDLVVIDGLVPFGLRHTVPLGRLREPLDALKRADALLVTRADNDIRFRFICDELRKFNETAPVFRIFTRPRQWRLCLQRLTADNLPVKRVAAFCALGNPQGFWNTLAKMGLDVVFRWNFPDHHSYQPIELRRIASQATALGAEILVTTEKDRVNFPRNFASSIEPLEVAWLEIETVPENEAAFLNWLEARLPRSVESA